MLQLQHVEGTPIDLKITWNGADKEYDVNEVINDSNGKEIAFKFGGNHDQIYGDAYWMPNLS